MNAHSIILALAHGHHPVTMRGFTKKDPLRVELTVKALHRAAETERIHDCYPEGFPVRDDQPMTKEEEADIRAWHQAGVSVEAIAVRVARTNEAVRRLPGLSDWLLPLIRPKMLLPSKARLIIQKLVAGVHPVTGEPLPEDHICHVPEIRDALRHACPLLTIVGRYEFKRPDRHGQAWTETERNEAHQEFRTGIPIKGIAARHDRTTTGIRLMLEKLGVNVSLSTVELPPHVLSLPAAKWEHRRLPKES